MSNEPDLFDAPAVGPPGFLYEPEVVSRLEEQRLIAELRRLPLQPFDFRGFLGARRVVSFGWRYDFGEARLHSAPPMPDFLEPLLSRAAAFASLGPRDLQQALITHYPAGAGIGWHRDRPQFGKVVGVSLGADCTLRFRRRQDDRWSRIKLVAEPRSIYLLDGPARSTWEHSIPPVQTDRYSVTFRALRG